MVAPVPSRVEDGVLRFTVSTRQPFGGCLFYEIVREPARASASLPAAGRPFRPPPYRLKDNYSRFYLKYVEPSADAIDADSFAFAGLEQFPGWETDMGLQFENLVLNNFRELLPHPRNVAIRTALVHSGELAPSVEACGFFDAIVTASKLLGL